LVCSLSWMDVWKNKNTLLAAFSNISYISYKTTGPETTCHFFFFSSLQSRILLKDMLSVPKRNLSVPCLNIEETIFCTTSILILICWWCLTPAVSVSPATPHLYSHTKSKKIASYSRIRFNHVKHIPSNPNTTFVSAHFTSFKSTLSWIGTYVVSSITLVSTISISYTNK
jgi:hypothetical protein